MALGDITASAVRHAIEEFDALGQEAFLRLYGFKKSRSYHLIYDGQRYPSKAIVGVAHGAARPDLGPLKFADFNGGEATVQPLLTRLGFEVLHEDQSQTVPGMRNPPWTRDELLLALDYYVQHPGTSHDPKSEGIIRLSAEINGVAILLGLTGSETLRNASGVSMKLLNFRAHDPAYTDRGRKGLSRGNKLEPELWERFAHDVERLHEIAEGIRARLADPHGDTANALAQAEDPDIAEAEEGRLVTRLHRSRERSRVLVKRKKASFRKRHGRLFCEACGFDFAKMYGARGGDFIECHHTRPVAFLTPGETTKAADLVLLCANCHRMVHVQSPWLSMHALKELIGGK
jgi:5-methylcytosine-specific restriction protein A